MLICVYKTTRCGQWTLFQPSQTVPLTSIGLSHNVVKRLTVLMPVADSSYGQFCLEGVVL